MHRSALLLSLLAALGCQGRARLQFPLQPARSDVLGRWYDLDGDGRSEFALLATGGDGHLRIAAYDDDQDGTFDRSYPLATADDETAPHLLILVDSLPFAAVAERHRRGGLRLFHPPAKVIPPFPTMSDLVFSHLVGAGPPPAMLSVYFDPLTQRRVDLIAEGLRGRRRAWEDRLVYQASYLEMGAAYLRPEAWFHAELERLRQRFAAVERGRAIGYLVSTSALLTRRGDAAVDLLLDGLEQLCARLVWERRGAVRISIAGDHGMVFGPTRRFDLRAVLEAAGFEVGSRRQHPFQVVVDEDGLVQAATLHTAQAAGLAGLLRRRAEVALAVYVDGDRVVLRDHRGTAVVEERAGRFRYRAIDHDVLGYAAVAAELARRSPPGDEGFASGDAWLGASADHPFPDAPPRLWGAFHGAVRSPADLVIVLADGWIVGPEAYAKLIELRGVHGGLDQRTSASFVLSTAWALQGPLRSEEVLPGLAGRPPRRGPPP